MISWRSFEDPIENYFVSPGAMERVQMAMKLEDSSYIPKIIDNFRKAFVGLSIKVDGPKFINTGKAAEPVKIPNNITDVDEAISYMVEFETPPIRRCLASIGYNDHIVAVNSSHICSDGGYLKMVVDHCLDDDIGKSPLLPASVIKTYGEQLMEGKKHMDEILPNEELTSFKLRPSNNLAPHSSRAEYIVRSMPIQTLKVYNPKTQRVSRMNESVYSSMCLAISAMNNELRNIAVCSCVDIRKYAKTPIDWTFANHYTVLNLIAKNVNQNTTISQVNDLLKEDFLQRSKKGMAFTSYYAPFQTGKDSAIAHVTHIGQLVIKKPFLDLSIYGTMNAEATENLLSLTTLSKVIGNTNTLYLRQRYAPSSITKKDATIITDLTKYALTKINLNTRVGDALKELKDFKSKLENEL